MSSYKHNCYHLACCHFGTQINSKKKNVSAVLHLTSKVPAITLVSWLKGILAYN